jgi:hypothetical protein
MFSKVALLISVGTMSSREKRPFWYFVLALGAAAIAVAFLAPGGVARRYEFLGGLAILLFSFVRLIFLRGRRRKRRRRVVKRPTSAQSPPPAA